MLNKDSTIGDILEIMNLPKNITAIINQNSKFFIVSAKEILNFKYPSDINNILKSTSHMSDSYIDVYFGPHFKSVVHYVNDVEHNDFGPNYVNISRNGCFCYLHYCKFGKLNRINGPAIVQYKDNLIVSEDYYINGKCHNPIGPSCRRLTKNKWHNYFYLNNKSVSLDQFVKNTKIKF
jgi:hypothetical protein